MKQGQVLRLQVFACADMYSLEVGGVVIVGCGETEVRNKSRSCGCKVCLCCCR